MVNCYLLVLRLRLRWTLPLASYKQNLPDHKEDGWNDTITLFQQYSVVGSTRDPSTDGETLPCNRVTNDHPRVHCILDRKDFRSRAGVLTRKGPEISAIGSSSLPSAALSPL
jgi:hypothetical protein